MLQFNNQQRKDGSDSVFQFLAGAPKFADFLFREYLFYFTNLFIFYVIIYKFVLNSLLWSISFNKKEDRYKRFGLFSKKKKKHELDLERQVVDIHNGFDQNCLNMKRKIEIHKIMF